MVTVSTMLFELGEVSFSSTVREALKETALSEAELLRQHQSGAWDDQPHLQTDNLAALANADWVCSSFALPTGKTVWLMTAPDRSSTLAILEEPQT